MQNVLVPLDLGKQTEDLIGFVIDFIRRKEARVTLLHVCTPVSEMMTQQSRAHNSLSSMTPGAPLSSFIQYKLLRDQVANSYKHYHQRMLNLSDEVRRHGIDCRSIMVEGDVVEKIIQESELLGSSYIIMANHGHGRIYRALLGGVYEAIVKRSVVPVLTVPQATIHSWQMVS